MKRIVASLSLTAVSAFSAFGLLGVGATSAAALPIPGVNHTALCLAVNTALLGNSVPLATAVNNHDTAASNLSAAVIAQASALATYATDAAIVIADLDAIPVSVNLSVDTANFHTATTAFVNSVLNGQTALTVEKTTSALLANLTLTQTVMSALHSSLGC